MPDLMALAGQERGDLLSLLTELEPLEWDVPSLCTGWTVKDVVAHMFSYDERSWPGLLLLFLRGGVLPGPVNARALRDYRERSPAELVELVASHRIPRGLTAGFGGGIALADGLIHQQDIRRPLGRLRVVPEDRLRATLDIAVTAPTLPTRSLVRGLRLDATDLDWTRGAGEIVRGPGESLLMAITGRTAALAEVAGSGVDRLRERVARKA